jgi:hypothetical protein
MLNQAMELTASCRTADFTDDQNLFTLCQARSRSWHLIFPSLVPDPIKE